MSKKNVGEYWHNRFGNQEEVYDYSGRLMKKSAIGNQNSSYEPTIDHIRPLSQQGKDVEENIVICNRKTNQEKSNKFSTWRANGKTFQAVRIRGNRSGYEIE
ncbi:MAG: HNH endonuclease domain-containing protein [archaeon]